MNIEKKLSRLHQIAARRHERGLSLTETLLVLGVIALIAVIAYAGYNAATGSVKIGGESQAVVQLQSNIAKTWASAADYSTVSTIAAIDAGIIPKNFKISGTGATRAVKNAFGGDIILTAQTIPAASPNKYQVVYNSVPSESCVEIAQAMSSAAQEVYVSASGTAAAAADAVKTVAAPSFNTGNAITKCAGAAPKQITVIGA